KPNHFESVAMIKNSVSGKCLFVIFGSSVGSRKKGCDTIKAVVVKTTSKITVHVLSVLQAMGKN
ncbi:hypothetical protein L917_11429, partial [Phytophthora nicotianae]